jgi:hypothetical protein
MDEGAKMVDAKTSSSAQKSGLVASDEIAATPIRRSSGEIVGMAKKLIIDMQNGRIAYVVLSFGGFLGMGEEQRALLPWGMLRYNETLGTLELDIAEERLREMPVKLDLENLGLAGRARDPSAKAAPRRDIERSEEATAAASESELEMDTLLERLDRKVAAEHIAMDGLLERIAVRAAQ